jgi:S-adenosylhomocysteine hydrolase
MCKILISFQRNAILVKNAKLGDPKHSNVEIPAEKKVYSVHEEINRKIAFLNLKAIGIKILTADQKKYLESWEMGA